MLRPGPADHEGLFVRESWAVASKLTIHASGAQRHASSEETEETPAQAMWSNAPACSKRRGQARQRRSQLIDDDDDDDDDDDGDDDW